MWVSGSLRVFRKFSGGFRRMAILLGDTRRLGVLRRKYSKVIKLLRSLRQGSSGSLQGPSCDTLLGLFSLKDISVSLG